MFDFLFKRSSAKATDAPAPLPAKAEAAAQQQALERRAEQVALAGTLAGNEAGALEFVLQSEFADVRLAAAEHIHSPALLEQARQAMRNTDRRVVKLMQGRLDLIRYRQGERQKAQDSVDSARRLLADGKFSPSQLVELDRLWQVVEPPEELKEEFAQLRASLGQRLEAQVRLQRAVIDAVAELRKLASSPLSQRDDAVRALERLGAEQAARSAAPEFASLPKHALSDFAAAFEQAGAALLALDQQQAALAARQAALDGWQAVPVDTLTAEQLQRAWRDLPRLPDGDAASDVQRQFEALLALLPQPQARAPNESKAPGEAREAKDGKDGKDGRAGQAPGGDGGRRFVEALDAMEAALQQGRLQLASERDKALRDMKTGRLSAAQSERLARARADFKQLSAWARWGGNVSREELVKAVEDLSAQTVPMGELAKKVGSMRESWKALDAVSGAAPKALWERFDAACSAAYAPAAAHFKQLSDERHNNAAKAQALIDETLALAGAASQDWKAVASASQRVRQGWTRLGPIDRKDKKRLDGEFGKALDALLAPLNAQRQIETARREQLIVEVAQLNPAERGTVDTLRALQEKWQEHAKMLPLERRAEQALWQRFRAACDQVFARRKECANAADHERRAHLHAKEALCVRLEQAELPDGDGKAATALSILLREVQREWDQVGPVPRASEAKIAQRHQNAVAAVQAKIASIAERAGAAQANALRDKLRLCQALEQAVAQLDNAGNADNPGDAERPGGAGTDWSARWAALPALEGRFERVLQARFDAAREALAGTRSRRDYAALLDANRAQLLADLLRLEILAGVDSGAEFARDRLKMQVEVLQSSLKSGQQQDTPSALLLQLGALPALADARSASRCEALLRRLGGSGLAPK